MITIHFQGFNVPLEESRARFEEALMLIKQAWTQETCSFDGKFFQVPPTRARAQALAEAPPAAPDRSQ